MKTIDAWESWFQASSPATERFLFLIDESSDFPQIETWSKWVDQNPGPGRALRTFVTTSWPEALESAPSLDLAVSTLKVADRRRWENAARRLAPGRRWLYNGARPATGTPAQGARTRHGRPVQPVVSLPLCPHWPPAAPVVLP